MQDLLKIPKVLLNLLLKEKRKISNISILGSANTLVFHQLFASFIMPLKENDVKIEFTITAKSKPNYLLTKASQQYKIVKESGSQLGFEVKEE